MQLLAERMNTNFIKYVILSVYHVLIFLFVLLVRILAIANLCELCTLKVCNNKKLLVKAAMFGSLFLKLQIGK